MNRLNSGLIVRDIRSGCGDTELMKRYRLSPKGLQKLMTSLVQERAISHEELYEKSLTYRSIVDILASRNSHRVYIPIPIKVFDQEAETHGFVRDLSEKGLRTAGLNANPGETVTLQLSVPNSDIARGVEFQAVCRWAQTEGKRKKYIANGFAITHIDDDARTALARLLKHIQDTHADQGEKLFTPLTMHELVHSARELRAARNHQFSGAIEGVDILDFVQFVLLSGQRKILEVHSERGEECRVYVENGKVVHAVQGGMQGKEAFFACMNYSGGRFVAKAWKGAEIQTIIEPGEFLLLEAARRRDEEARKSLISHTMTSTSYDDTTQLSVSDDSRRDLVWYPFSPIPLYDADNLQSEGNILEVGAKGFTVTGIRASVGERKNLLMYIEDLPELYPFSFEAECRWNKVESDGVLVAGFEITVMTDIGSEQLRKLLNSLAFSV